MQRLEERDGEVGRGGAGCEGEGEGERVGGVEEGGDAGVEGEGLVEAGWWRGKVVSLFFFYEWR